jgi:hypothetical protein
VESKGVESGGSSLALFKLPQISNRILRDNPCIAGDID